MSKSKKKEAAKIDDDFENSILARLRKEYQQPPQPQQPPAQPAEGEEGQVKASSPEEKQESAGDVTLLFCGAKKSGKTSLIDRFINPTKDEKDAPKPTVALDYKFARYDPTSATSSSTTKLLAHIYDLGGEECNDNLSAIAISPSTIGNIIAAIVVDLSEPHSVLANLDKWLKLLKAQVASTFDALTRESDAGARRVAAIQAARQAAVEAAYAEHPDAQLLRPFPIQLVIFGSKWDLLTADQDREKVKSLCRALRFIAHTNAASLVFASTRDKVAMKGATGILKQLVFGASSKGGLPEQLDPSKPLFCMPGKDSFQALGVNNGNQSTEKGLSDAVADLFPDPARLSKDVKKSEAVQLAEDLPAYPESGVDAMVEQRLGELQQYRKQVERNQRLASEGITSKEGVLAN